MAGPVKGVRRLAKKAMIGQGIGTASRGRPSLDARRRGGANKMSMAASGETFSEAKQRAAPAVRKYQAKRQKKVRMRNR